MALLTNHIHIVVVKLDILGDDGLDNSINNRDQHNEKEQKVHVTSTNVFFLEANRISIFFFTFGLLLRCFESEFTLSLHNFCTDDTTHTIEITKPEIG